MRICTWMYNCTRIPAPHRGLQAAFSPAPLAPTPEALVDDLVLGVRPCLPLLRKLQYRMKCLLFSTFHASMRLRSTDDASTEEKSEYELLRDARVAELAAKFKPLKEAAESL